MMTSARARTPTAAAAAAAAVGIATVIALAHGKRSVACSAFEASGVKEGSMEFRRADGVRIQHDPTDPRIVAKYGQPGRTDDEGFDPYSDTVGPGIYGAHSADRRTQLLRPSQTGIRAPPPVGADVHCCAPFRPRLRCVGRCVQVAL